MNNNSPGKTCEPISVVHGIKISSSLKPLRLFDDKTCALTPQNIIEDNCQLFSWHERHKRLTDDNQRVHKYCNN